MSSLPLGTTGFSLNLEPVLDCPSVNFGTVLATLSRFLEDQGHRYAVIGGIALAAYGLPRTTLDLDLLVGIEAQAGLVPFLESLGYRTLHRTSGYSNHEHPDPSWGSVDLVYIQGETRRKLFDACQWRQGPLGQDIPLPKPEHLAALKVQALKNDPSRTFQDLADVRFLFQLPGVDRKEIRAYFAKHGLESRLDELERSL